LEAAEGQPLLTPEDGVDANSIDPKSVDPKPCPKLNFIQQHRPGDTVSAGTAVQQRDPLCHVTRGVTEGTCPVC